MSADLIWECVKNDSSFIRRPPTQLNIQGKPVFNAEAGNLMGIHAKKFSGLSGNVLDIKSVKNGKKETIILVTTHKNKSRSLRPTSRHVETGLSKAPAKANVALERVISKGYYRRDLLELAKQKYAKVKTSFKTKAKAVRKSRFAGK